MNEDLRGTNNWTPGGCHSPYVKDAHTQGYDTLPVGRVVFNGNLVASGRYSEPELLQDLPVPARVPTFLTAYSADLYDETTDTNSYYTVAATSIVEAAQKVSSALLGPGKKVMKIELSEDIEEVLV